MTVKFYIMIFLNKVLPVLLSVITAIGGGASNAGQSVKEYVTEDMTIAEVPVTLTDEESNILAHGDSYPNFFVLKRVYGIEYCKKCYDDYVVVMKSPHDVWMFYYDDIGNCHCSIRNTPCVTKDQIFSFSKGTSIKTVMQTDADGDYFTYQRLAERCPAFIRYSSHLTTDGYYIEIKYDENWKIEEMKIVLE